jgi:hypothetical protein
MLYICFAFSHLRTEAERNELPKLTVNGSSFEINPNEKRFMQNSISKALLKIRFLKW